MRNNSNNSNSNSRVACERDFGASCLGLNLPLIGCVALDELSVT